MTDELIVVLAGTKAGRLVRRGRGRLSLIYDHEWRNDTNAYPLGVRLSLTAETHEGRPLLAFLEGLLPDSKDLREEWGKRFGVAGDDTFGLLSHMGEDCAGAVQFVRPERAKLALGKGPEQVKWLTDAQVADLLRNLAAGRLALMDAERVGHFSLAGMQRKVALLKREERWGEPAGRTPTTHILKPPFFPGQAENEHICLEMARALGLPAAVSSIQNFEDQQVLVVERYDRVQNGTGKRLGRRHQEDCCQALAKLPNEKYEIEGGPGARDIAELLWQVSVAKPDDVRAFVKALALNWLLIGTDAHAKNYSLLHEPGGVRLAPLYDLASAWGLPRSRGAASALAMSVGGARRAGEVRRSHWEALARHTRLSAETVINLVRELADRVPSAAEEVLERGTELRSKRAHQRLSALTDWSQQCLSRLTK